MNEMKIGDTVFAIIDPETNRVLGTGDADALSTIAPDADEIEFTRKFCGVEHAEVVECVLVATPPR